MSFLKRVNFFVVGRYQPETRKVRRVQGHLEERPGPGREVDQRQHHGRAHPSRRCQR